MTKRLFIFASYDRDNIIDPTLLHYLNALSQLGDIVFTMDNDTTESEMSKIRKIPNVLHATATRHAEYDFGSYKRGYIWARDNYILDKYDWVYLVNDSVYGPLFDIHRILEDLESRDADVIGMTYHNAGYLPAHVQSWFLGMKKSVATSKYINEFLQSVISEPSKGMIVAKYEFRLSQLCLQHGCKLTAFLNLQTNDGLIDMYLTPLKALKAGIPFIKKAIETSLKELDVFVYPYTTTEFIQLMYAEAARCNRKSTEKNDEYKTAYRITLFGVPLLRIYRKQEHKSKCIAYKVALFDLLPIIRFSSNVTLPDK